MNILVEFIISGSIYVSMETMLDNTSHRSMFLAGGLAFMLCTLYIGLPYWLMSLLMALTILVIELIFGLIFNKNYTIWDYRKYKWNIKGQICFRFFMVWLVAMPPVILWLDGIFKALEL